MASLRFALALLTVLALPGVAQAQAPGGVQVKLGGGFSANIGDGNRLVARVSGREAAPVGNQGAMRITGFKLETYRDSPNREVELLVESPEAVFDQRTGARSSRALTLRSADQRFAIAGEGWSWDRATGNLVISNRVEATLQRAGSRPAAPAPTNQPPVTVLAARLDYNLKSGDTRFSGGSTATEPDRARVAAQELVTRLTPSADKPESISGLGGVTIDLLRPGHTGRVLGTSARYDALAGSETILVEGPATWTLGANSGAADTLELQPGAETYAARGNARLRLAPRPPNTAQPNPAPDQARRAPVDVSADLIDAKPGTISFRGHVFAQQTNRLELQATELIATLGEAQAGSTDRDRLREATATGDVIARVLSTREPTEIRGARLHYTLAETPKLVVTGQPSWSVGQSTGKARQLTLHPDQTEFLADGEVEVEWRGSGPAAARRAPIRLQAAAMKATREQVRFTGDVRAGREGWDLRSSGVELGLGTNGVVRSLKALGEVDLDYRVVRRAPDTNTQSRAHGPLVAIVRDVSEEASRWKIHAQAMEATLDPETQDLSRLDAHGQVTIDQLAVRARADRLAYQANDGLLRLTENAEVKTADGLEIIGEPATILVFDPRTARFQIEGPLKRPMRLPWRNLQAKEGTARPSRP